MSLWERTWQPLDFISFPNNYFRGSPRGTFLYSALPCFGSQRHQVSLPNLFKHLSISKSSHLKGFFLIYILFCHRGAPLISDNILSMGLRCWQETNSQGWQKLGMCCKEVVSHTPPEKPPHPFPLHSPIPIPSEGCFCWIIDAKVLLIRKKETSNHLAEKNAGWEGVRRLIKCLENAAKGRINQSHPHFCSHVFCFPSLRPLLHHPSMCVLLRACTNMCVYTWPIKTS